MNFEKIYRDSKEEELIQWKKQKDFEDLKESVITDAKEGVVPQERMSKAFRVFESFVTDEDWKELRETIIDCENLERKIFHRGFEFALKEDQNHILEEYARIATFDNKIHLTESYSDIDLWNNDKRRKELDKERIKGDYRTLLENINHELLKEELREMLNRIFEAGIDLRTEFEKKLGGTPKSPIIPAVSAPEPEEKVEEKKEEIKDEVKKDLEVINQQEGTDLTLKETPEEKVIVTESPESEAPVPEEKLQNTDIPEKVEEINNMPSAPETKEEVIAEPPENRPTPGSSELEKMGAQELKSLTDSTLNSISEKDKVSFTYDKIFNKLNSEDSANVKDSASILMNPKKREKLYNQQKGEANQARLRGEATRIRLLIMENVLKHNPKQSDAFAKEYDEQKKRNSIFGKIKTKILTFLKTKAPFLMKIISLGATIFSIGVRFKTIAAPFMVLPPPANIIVPLVLAAAMFFIQRAILRVSGKITDAIVAKIFNDFLRKPHSGLLKLICDKLKSPDGEKLTKLLVRTITAILIARPTAQAMTELVQKNSAEMVSAASTLGIKAQELGNNISHIDPEAKLGEIVEDLNTNNPLPTVEEIKNTAEQVTTDIRQTVEQVAEDLSAKFHTEVSPLDLTDKSPQFVEAMEILQRGAGNMMPNGYTLTQGDINWAKTFLDDPSGKAAYLMRLKDISQVKVALIQQGASDEFTAALTNSIETGDDTAGQAILAELDIASEQTMEEMGNLTPNEVVSYEQLESEVEVPQNIQQTVEQIIEQPETNEDIAQQAIDAAQDAGASPEQAAAAVIKAGITKGGEVVKLPSGIVAVVDDRSTPDNLIVSLAGYNEYENPVFFENLINIASKEKPRALAEAISLFELWGEKYDPSNPDHIRGVAHFIYGNSNNFGIRIRASNAAASALARQAYDIAMSD